MSEKDPDHRGSEPPARNLGLSKADLGASVLKAGLSFVPFAGPVLTELVNDFIPGQRTDRLVAFVQALDARLTEVTKEVFAARARTSEGADLVEDGLWMAARALSDERRKAIANLLARSLTADEMKYAEAKKLLQLLDQLQDAELIYLKYFALQDRDATQAFYALHESVLAPVVATMGSPEEELDDEELQTSYKLSLRNLGLLNPGSDTEVGWLGKMLLRYIGAD